VTGTPRDGRPAADQDASALVRPVAELLRDVVGEDDAWLDGVGAGTRVDGDLLVESHELAAWSLALRERYGERVDLAAHVAGLDIDGIIALTVGDVAVYVAAHGAANAAANGAAHRAAYGTEDAAAVGAAHAAVPGSGAALPPDGG
jgi:hypothetical protein